MSQRRAHSDTGVIFDNPRAARLAAARAGGSPLFLAAVIAMALSPWYGLAFFSCLGLGSTAFSTMQTTLVLIEATTSRVMGIVTM